MSPLEILVAAIGGQPAPRIPVFCNLIDQGVRELGVSPAEFYRNGELMAKAQLALLKKYGHDNVWSLSYVGKEAEFFGCRDILFADDGPPNVADFVIKSWDDIAKLEVPEDITRHPAWSETGRCLSILRDEVGATHPVCAYLTAANTLPTLLMGIEKWLELLMTGPADLIDELMKKCSAFFRQELAACRAAGANVLVYSTPFGSTSFVGKKRFEQFSLPTIRRDLENIDMAGLVFYCGMAPFNDVIASVRREFGFGAYYISPLADLAEAKRLIGDSGLTCGVIDDIHMLRWSPDQVRAEVKRICDIGKPGGRFLFGTGVMPLDVPEANIRAMLDAAFEYGRLP